MRMWLYFCLQFVLLLSHFVSSKNIRSGSEVHLHHDDNVTCEPTKCPAHCPGGSGGYYYYYDSTLTCLRCKCGRPKGPADCGEDIDPSMCDYVNFPKACDKNSTVRQSCQFSCSLSGQLWWSASKGNLEEVNTAIAAGANPTCQKPFLLNVYRPANMTAFHLAAWYNHPKMIVTLLNAAVDINLQTAGGSTPIFYASKNGSIDALQVLIEHNADVNLADNDGYTPLIIAASEGQLSVAKALINANANLDVTGGRVNATALNYAVFKNNPDIALLLIEHNADVNIAASNGVTPLIEAALEGQLSVAKALIKANASLDVTGGPANATALYWAAYHNTPDIALLLIEHNANVNIGAISGSTPLMMAARWGFLSVAKALINSNASLDVRGWANATARCLAAYYNPNIALLLIEHNADVNIADKDGDTPLMQAAVGGHLSVAKALIKANASLDVTGGWANATALYIAAFNNNPDIALLLIEHNANVKIAASDGDTPLMQAAVGGHLSVAKALINANASLDVTGGWVNATALHYAARNNKQDIALLLIAHNADVNIAASNGDTPLIEAAVKGQLSVVKALINANASLDVTGGWANATALYYAAIYDKQDIALLLLQSGADAMITNEDGRTPAEAAKYYQNYESEDLIDNYSTSNTQGL